MNNLKDLKIIGGSSHLDLTSKICQHLGIAPVGIEYGKYPNDDQWVRISGSVRKKEVFIIQTAVPPVDYHLMQLLMLVDAAHRGSAKEITVITPYFFYVRSDKKDEPRISITAQLVCELVKSAGADRIVSVELHTPQVQGYFKVFDNLQAGKFLCSAFYDQHILQDGDFAVIAPDKGGTTLNGDIAAKRNFPLIGFFDKKRIDSNKVKVNFIGDPKDVKGKKIIMFDDEILTGGTLITDASELKKMGAEEIYGCAFHGIFAGDAIANIEKSDLTGVIVTNTLPQVLNSRVRVVDISELLAEAIRRIYLGESVSELF